MRVLLCLALIATCVMCAASSGKFSTCCTKVSAAKPPAGTEIESFIIQKKDLPCVHAVMFITNKGQIICSSPKADWVKKMIKEISNRKKEENKKKEEEESNA